MIDYDARHMTNWPKSDWPKLTDESPIPGGIHELAEEPPRDDSDAGEELEPSSDMVI